MAISELKQLHPYLFKRVQLKGILFTLLGLSSMFSHQIDAFFHSERNNVVGVSVYYTGAIFLILGLGILYSLYSAPNRYKLARKFLYGCLVYALFWEFVLLMLAFTKHISTVSIFILWGYLTYNLLLISKDSAWEGAEIIKEIQENPNGAI